MPPDLWSGGHKNHYLLYQNWLVLHLMPFTQGCFAPNLVEIGPVVLEKKIINFVNVFVLLGNYLPLEKWGGSFIWTNLNPLYPRMNCAKFGWNWPSGSDWEVFLIFVNVFLLFAYYLPLEKGEAFHLKKLESPLPMYASCQVWLKMAKWFWRRRWNFVKFTTMQQQRRQRQQQDDDGQQTDFDQKKSFDLSAQVS